MCYPPQSLPRIFRAREIKAGSGPAQIERALSLQISMRKTVCALCYLTTIHRFPKTQGIKT